jgi:hypothetical protein
MLKKVVPYHPVIMRPAQRMIHHLIQASCKFYALTTTINGFGKVVVKHYGKQ